ncbi:DNA alkylation repair protein [Candidatus Cloacimonadota bacterium]
MLTKIGRLDTEAKNELQSMIESIYAHLRKNKLAKAEKALVKIASTPNYFIREYVGKQLINYEDQDVLFSIAQKMISHKIYGVRATALFFFYSVFKDSPEDLIEVLEDTYEHIPWEVESIINEMWKKYPDLMKVKMYSWIESEDSQKRALSFHGMENIAHSDPQYIMEFIGKAIDDETIEVQKKITHILTQVARANPIIVFPYVREWLSEANEKRIKTIWVSMKKLANIVIQRNRREKSEEFVLLTQQTINDWTNDENDNVSKMGEKLSHIVNR